MGSLVRGKLWRIAAIAGLGVLQVGRAPGAEPSRGPESARGGRPGQAHGTETPEHRLEWTFPRFRLWQAVTSTVLSGTNLWLEHAHKTYDDRRWTSGILFDDAARRRLRADSAEGRDRADVWSDLFWYPVQYYPVVIDSLFVPLVTDDLNYDVAAQMTLIDWQAIATSFFLIRGAHFVIGRARPDLEGCSDDPAADDTCSKHGSAFPSGHTGMAATGAGLACAHHQALPLYGGGWVEAIPCVVLSAGAATNGVLRVVADRHWATDVIVGYAIGFASGYGIASLLHYGAGEDGANVMGLFRSDLLPDRTVVTPLIRQGAWGVSIVGWE